MQPSKTEFRGAEALRLATRKIELIAPTGFGPRLLSLRSLAGGPNLLLEFPRVWMTRRARRAFASGAVTGSGMRPSILCAATSRTMVRSR